MQLPQRRVMAEDVAAIWAGGFSGSRDEMVTEGRRFS